MKTYLVGGAVRDKLLGLSVKERDFVVVGATPDSLLEKGFKPVGKDFPVFLHPKSHEEYALARTERKVAPGYKGFTFHAAPDVTLEEDLKRRDLTINAIAEDDQGQLIDPFHGQQDLNNKILRHVSPAFSEDPVRILRIARFAAKLPDFSIAPASLSLMKKMVAAGEVDALVAERVWQEFEKALGEKAPERFFTTLKACDALTILFPGVNDLSPFNKAHSMTQDKTIRFAIFAACCDDLNTLMKKLRTPTEYRQLAELIDRYSKEYEVVIEKNTVLILTLLQKTDAYRRKARFKCWLLACEAVTNKKEPKIILEKALKLTESVRLTDKEFSVLSGKEIQQKITEKRQQILKENLL